MADKPSLDEFAAAQPGKQGQKSYLDGLPDDVQTQLMSSKAGHAVATKWLHDLGHDKATQQMVSGWRKKRGWTW